MLLGATESSNRRSLARGGRCRAARKVLPESGSKTAFLWGETSVSSVVDSTIQRVDVILFDDTSFLLTYCVPADCGELRRLTRDCRDWNAALGVRDEPSPDAFSDLTRRCFRHLGRVLAIPPGGSNSVVLREWKLHDHLTQHPSEFGIDVDSEIAFAYGSEIYQPTTTRIRQE